MKKKILIVEDEIIIAENIKFTLKKFGYDVSGIISFGEDAVEIAREFHPDLVLMDIKLEGKMNGIEAADIIFKEFEIPIIFLTSFGDEDTVKQAAMTEPYGYILKPFEDRMLCAAIEMAFYKHQMEKKLRNSEKFLKLIIDTDPNLIFVKDENGKYVLANKSMAKLLGISPDSIIGKTDKEIAQFTNVHFEETNGLLKDDKKVIENRETILIPERAIKLPGGKIKWYQSTKVPIISKKKIEGILEVVVDITERKKTEEKLKKSYERLNKLLRETVNGLVSAMEMRDPYTAGHQRRVAALASAIATEMNLKKDVIAGVFMASLIHDIGKMLIPSEILSKPSKLTEAEINLIKFHPQAGFNALQSIEFPWPVAQIVLQHHEKLDGSSYPNGLKKKEILIQARIICVADVIEAMSSHRPYRPAAGIDEALNEIIKNKGILYDEDVVEACENLFKEKKFKF